MQRESACSVPDPQQLTSQQEKRIVKHESLHNAVYIQSGILQSSHNTQEDKSVALYPTILQLMPQFPSIANFHDAVVRR